MVGLFRATDLEGDGRSEIATVHFDVLLEHLGESSQYNVLEVWGRNDTGDYSSVKDWRAVQGVESATRMEVLHFERESRLDFLFLEEAAVQVWSFQSEDHMGKGAMPLPYVYTEFYVLSDVLQRGRRVAVGITRPYPHHRDHHCVVVADWRGGGPVLSSPIFDEQIHALATGNVVGDVRHEILVAVSREGGRPYLDVRCIGNRDERQFELCGSVALEHVPERLAVLGLGDERAATIVYAADGKLYRLDIEPASR